MDVSDKNARVWKSERKTKDGEPFFDYSLGVSKKGKDGKYVNHYIRVRFAASAGVPEVIPNGATMDYEGFVSVDAYPGKDGKLVTKPCIVVMKADFKDQWEEADEDIPF